MPRSEESRKAFIKGYRAGWKQCVTFVSCFVPGVSGEALEKLINSMEITERNFIPKPFKDRDRKAGLDAYSEQQDDSTQ
jgi:hypothetical protein